MLEDSHSAIRLPERSTTPEPLVVSPLDDAKPPPAPPQAPPPAALPLSITVTKKAAARLRPQRTEPSHRRMSSDEIEEDISDRFAAEAEELMNPNFQSEYSEECIDSLQIFFGSQASAKSKARAETAAALRPRPTRSNGKPPLKPAMPRPLSGLTYDARKRHDELHDDVVVEPQVRLGRMPQRPSWKAQEPSPMRPGRATEPNAVQEDDEVEAEALYETDGASDGAVLSESGMLRAMELDADSSGDENGDAFTSDSEYGGEENFYSEHSAYSDDSDFADENETEYSEDFEDQDAEIIEYANDAFDPEESEAARTLKSPGGRAGLVTANEVQWVIHNVAQSLRANLSVAS
ncbi:hypothetical protein PINS_up019178 [Pythium insidiosum]|nr:hypothetical protein PINS_up019178 [Pythium insidiosum]